MSAARDGAGELVVFPPSSVAGLAAITYRVISDERDDLDEQDKA